MARLPKKLFEHYMYSPYALPVCRDFLENMGCGSECLLAHPPRRVRIFHPRFFSEEFPAGIVICCKNFVHYGDCSCRHMLPSAKSAMVLDLFFHPPHHVCEYIKNQVEASAKEKDLESKSLEEADSSDGMREEASGESEGPFTEVLPALPSNPSPPGNSHARSIHTDSSPSPDLPLDDLSTMTIPPPRSASEPSMVQSVLGGPRMKPATPIPIRPPGVLPGVATSAAMAAAAASMGLGSGSSPALLNGMRSLEERAALVSLTNPIANLLGLGPNPLCIGLGAGAFQAGGVQ